MYGAAFYLGRLGLGIGVSVGAASAAAGPARAAARGGRYAGRRHQALAGRRPRRDGGLHGALYVLPLLS